MAERPDHERLDVYRVSLQVVAEVWEIAKHLSGPQRFARDQLIRSSQSIPLNIAEGNGKKSGPDRVRYFEIARGSAMEAAATLDVLVATGSLSEQQVESPKQLLLRIVSMLARLAPPRNGSVAETETPYDAHANGRCDEAERE